jgi:hypothetical protein
MAAKNRDFYSATLGVLAFLTGIGLLLLTFYMAYNLYYEIPEKHLGLQPEVSVDLNKTGDLMLQFFVRTALKGLALIVMGVIGGLITHGGIKLYRAAWSKERNEKEVETS